MAASENDSDRKADQQRRTLNDRLSSGGWLLYALELLFLVVIFGWLFLTTQLAG